jgi:hypothetical protein
MLGARLGEIMFKSSSFDVEGKIFMVCRRASGAELAFKYCTGGKGHY